LLAVAERGPTGVSSQQDGAGRARAPARDARSGVGRVLSLQRSVGNHAFSTTLAASSRGPTALGKALDDASPGRELPSGVRIHADGRAAALAAELGAEALTRGRDIYFGAGRYAPESEAGRRLLRHELGHVVQQARGDVSAFAGTVVPPEHPTEARATADADLETPALAESSSGVAIQRQLVAGAGTTTFHFDEKRPWLYSVDGSDVEASTQLYGTDLTDVQNSAYAGIEDSWFGESRENDLYFVIPEALRPPYSEQFRTSMRESLGRDVDRVEDILLNGLPALYPAQADELVTVVWRWSQAKDIRLEDGTSYFDAFLARLRRDSWYTDYFVTESASHTYFDTLLSEGGPRMGEISGLITQYSREFGGYRPTWMLFDPTGGPRKDVSTSVNPDVVKRTTDLVIEHLSGLTGGGESRVVADILTGLPGPELAAVIQELMSRYASEGEAWDVGMLYWVFEDLTAEDRAVVAMDLKARGIMDADTVDALASGRGWGGKYLPYTTRKGEEAAMYWADVVNNSSGPKKWGGALAGGFASLWTPHTAAVTVLTLATPGIGKGLVGAVPAAADVLAVAGTGIASFQVTISLQELITGKNVWTGVPLDEGEKIASVLRVVSNVLFLGAGFAAAAEASTTAGAGTGPGGSPNIRWFATRSPDGTWTIHGENLATGEQAVIRIDGAGNGAVVNLTTGAVASISNFQVQALAGLLGGTEAVGAAAAGEAGVEVGEWLSLPGEVAALGIPVVAPAPPFVPPAIPILAAGSGATLGSFLSSQSLARIQTEYGVSVRNATAAAQTWTDVDTIANGLGNVGSQYKGLVGEVASADAALYEGFHTGAQHTSSNQPGPDVPTASASGAPRIVMRESKVGTSTEPYRVGRSGMPAVYRQGTTAVREYIWSIIRNKSLPTAVRARFKLALDEGAIEWQLDTYGNVRVKMSGTDQFPGDVVITTPIVLPMQ
jgi:hypothetical protein